MYSMIVILGLTFTPILLAAQGSPRQKAPHAIVVLPDQVTWKAAPPAFPAGAQAAVLEGNPSEEGPFTMRLSFPDKYRIPPHFHAGVERVTVIQGTFRVGMGEKFDASGMTALPPGTFAALQPGTRHYAEADGKTVVQLNGIGPWKLTYVNSADDPRKKTP